MKPLTVILDAGHGKETPGKRSQKLCDGRQLFEWKFTRDVCNKIYCLLQMEGIKCIIANRDDVDYKLSDRATRINNLYNKEKKLGHLAIMISVHGNACGNGEWKTAHGWEVFSTEGTTNSDRLAKCFCNVFEELFPDKKLRGHKEKNFTIIYKTNCPCVLTENFFYDNKEECEFMLSEEGQMQIAELHVNAIKKYIETT